MKEFDWIRELLLSLLEETLRAWPTSLTLIAADLMPLVGILWFDWNPGSLLILIWAETAIIGICTMAKLAFVSGRRALLFVPVTALVFLFLSEVQKGMALTMAQRFSAPMALPGPDVSTPLILGMAWPITVFAATHVMSFLYHFLWQGEFRRLTPWQVARPCLKRVGLLQVGATAAIAIIAPNYGFIWALPIVVAAKTAVDLWLHLEEHARPRPATAGGVPATAPRIDPVEGGLAGIGLADPKMAFGLGLLFGPVGMFCYTPLGAVAMLFLAIPLGHIGFAFATELAGWTGIFYDALPLTFLDFALVLAAVWLFAFLPCGYWAWRAARTHNRRLGIGGTEPPPSL